MSEKSEKYTSFKEFAEVKSRHMISAHCVGRGLLRWEYRPGSTLYFVWTQERSGFDQFGDFNFSRDRSALFRDRPTNIFQIKGAYWIGR
jgi:hypothetical protein